MQMVLFRARRSWKRSLSEPLRSMTLSEKLPVWISLRLTPRGTILIDFTVLSKGITDPSSHGALRALRAVKHERNQRQLFLLDKDARLRSGARGKDARKALIAFEKVVDDSTELYDHSTNHVSSPSITPLMYVQYKSRRRRDLSRRTSSRDSRGSRHAC